MVANIVINISNSSIDQDYAYVVPSFMHPFIAIGARVVVPFGESNRESMGYVVSISEEQSFAGPLKSIIKLLDYDPFLSEEDIAFAKLLKDELICPLASILNWMLPDLLNIKTTQKLYIPSLLALDANLAMAIGPDKIITDEIEKKYSDVIAREIINKNIIVKRVVEQPDLNKYQEVYLFNFEAKKEVILNYSDKIQRFFLKKTDEVWLPRLEFMDKYDLSGYYFNKLLKDGLLLKKQQVVPRLAKLVLPMSNDVNNSSEKNVDNVYNLISSPLNKPVLYVPSAYGELEEVIFKVIENLVSITNRLVIFVPNITSSYEVYNRLPQNYQKMSRVINSNISSGVYYDLFLSIINKECSIIIATPKAALLPISDVRYTFMLDCESNLYYNEQSPMFDLKWILQQKAKIHNSNLIMCSFLPRFMEYCKAIKDEFILKDFHLEQPERDIKVVDMKEELLKGNNLTISKRLQNALKENIENQKVTILLINRKAYYTSFICRHCGETLKCPKCGVLLEYSKKRNQLSCPNCSFHTPMVDNCPICGYNDFMYSGLGMEKVENDLKQLFPISRIYTLVDSNYKNFFACKEKLEKHQLDIILTNESYSRMLETNDIHTIGILQFDSILKAPNVDAYSNAYSYLVTARQMLEQDDSGNMIIQTYDIQNDIIRYFITNNYHDFFIKELSSRKQLFYEPYCEINRILLKGSNKNLFVEANQLKYIIKDIYHNQVYVLGPNYNLKYQAVQLILKYGKVDITPTLKKIYEAYKKKPYSIIIERYPKYL